MKKNYISPEFCIKFLPMEDVVRTSDGSFSTDGPIVLPPNWFQNNLTP